MSLAVKKEIENLKPKIEETQKGIAEAVGKVIQLEVDWNSFHTPESVSALNGNCFPSIWADLRNLCQDETCKQAVAAGVKKIRIVQDDKAPQGSMNYKDNVLTLRTEWVNNYFGGLAVKEYLLKAL